MPRIARHVVVSGRVQGVAFRWYAEAEAQRLGIAGWVRNLDDGRVEAWVEGEAAPVESMLAWLAHGPPHARVAGCEVAPREPADLAAFEIRRGGF